MIGNNEEALIGVKINLDTSNINSAVGKLSKDITDLGTKAELAMLKLNPKSNLYKSLFEEYKK